MPSARTLLTFAAALALLAGTTDAAANDTVYKWTDANGVTHYGDAPPSEGEYEKSDIPAADRAAPDAATTTAVGAGAAVDAGTGAEASSQVPGEDPQCATVRRHLALLRSDGPVQQDSDGDGKADRILSQADREAQAALAEKMLATTCATPET